MSSGAWLAVTIIGAAGAVISAYLMHWHRQGIPALKAINREFDCPDMRFRYAPDWLFQCLEDLGDEGRKLLRRFWTIDFVFILSLWLVMLSVTHNTATIAPVRMVMYLLSTLRAFADALENALLLRICDGSPAGRPEGMARAASLVTSVKWCLMGLWVVGLFFGLMLQAARL